MSVSKTVENVYLRHEAVQLTRRNLWRLLGMTLITSLISVGLEYLLFRLGGLMAAGSSAAAESLIVEAAAADSLALSGVMNLISWVVSGIISGGLMLGYNAQFISAGRGGIPKVWSVFERMRFCLKGWGLNLLTGLKVLFWLLPGLLTIIVGAELQLFDYATAGQLVVFAGTALLIGLGMPAGLRYTLAPYIMADEPDRGIRECITLSKGLTKDRKWQCFKLGVPMILKMLGMFFITNFVSSLAIVFFGLRGTPYIIEALSCLFILPCLYFSIQLNMAYALFYLKRREPAADAPVSYWLRKDPPLSAQPVSAWLEANPAETAAPNQADACAITDTSAESTADSPEDISHETNDEKEYNHE